MLNQPERGEGAARGDDNRKDIDTRRIPWGRGTFLRKIVPEKSQRSRVKKGVSEESKSTRL